MPVRMTSEAVVAGEKVRYGFRKSASNTPAEMSSSTITPVELSWRDESAFLKSALRAILAASAIACFWARIAALVGCSGCGGEGGIDGGGGGHSTTSSSGAVGAEVTVTPNDELRLDALVLVIEVTRLPALVSLVLS